ncbi:type VI secretion system ATPase TssH [Ketobacter sp. MCCC 1A13808]|uniref:type VI secretion system ATPase TssH n=1 Tax=Ketobacter sp. MCCC 1A13808 TaxID=2602738 RepID=UPI0012EB78D9|nr:type VI secretion system ATPase TssH [Ketobacter sp. MCCC 1A13808]MVF13992.1 type VI secretion system ATPase TssH [Ketobacter sp. MCCC 1A13808]
MINVNLKSLVDKMSPTLRDALEGAAGLCIGRSHYNVEVEHWLLKLLEVVDCDFGALLERYEIESSRVAAQLTDAVEKFQTGSARPAALAPAIVDASKNAWMISSVDFGHGRITSGHLLVALMLDEQSRRSLLNSVPELSGIAPESLRETAKVLIGGTAESAEVLLQNDGSYQSGSGLQSPSGRDSSGQPSQTPALDKFTINLTERARQGKIDAVLGRDEEIRQCIDILTRRRQNNPIFTGEAGVGKTAVVEGFALRIALGDVPEPLKNAEVHTLDLGLLQAGASVKGEFENRLKSVIEEVKSAAKPIIMFIDEAHTMIGAGGSEGQGDAANLLKPALARGELRTIAATTWAEYKKYFERDPALTRRFQVVKVEEPDEDKAINMMRGISSLLQDHHQVRILDEAIEASVKLSHRYIPGRQLPDKSVSLLDTACARVALSLTTTPSAIEDCRRRMQQNSANLAMLEKENAATGVHEERITALQTEQQSLADQLVEFEDQWQREKETITEIRQLRGRIETDFLKRQQTKEDADSLQSDPGQGAELKYQLAELNARLSDIQGPRALMQADVDAQAIAEVVANWTGIPVGKMVGDEIQGVLTIQQRLAERVIGQDHALDAVAQAIRTSRAGLTDPRKPIGVFLFVGTSGVGKTETALALADLLYGGEQNMTTINMSEFKEEHKVSMLLGSPPGYVGFGEGGVLTEAARRKPYSIILLDEMEKAHPGVQDIFYNLFDKGSIKDGEGRDIDFKNTIIIMTSNAGEDAIRALYTQSEQRPEPEALLQNIRPQLLNHFKPAFIGRTTLVAYNPLDDEDMTKIAAINMSRIEKRVRSHYAARFSYDDAVLTHIVARCQEAETGARNIENILNKSMLPALASECLQRMANEESISHIHVGLAEHGEFVYHLS